MENIDKRLQEAITTGGKEAIEIMKEVMESLKDFETWKEWRNTEPVQLEWDDSHELNNVMSKMVDEVLLYEDTIIDLPRGEVEPVPFYLQDWRTIDEHSEEYIDILYKTQELVPVDSGMSFHCHHSDYNVDGIIYRLTWGFTDVESTPTMQRRFN
jgi:hypothetical protein